MIRKYQKHSGQAMTEYIIIVALIGIAAISLFLLYGWVVRPQQAALAAELSGTDGKPMQIEAFKSARAAAELSKDLMTLETYAGRQK